MPDDHTQPFDGLARWLNDDTRDAPSMPNADPADEHPRRRRRRAAALVLPWAVTVGVLTVTALDRADTAAVPSAAGAPRLAAGADAAPPAGATPATGGMPAAGAGDSGGAGAAAGAPSGTASQPAGPRPSASPAARPAGDRRAARGDPPSEVTATAAGLVRDALTGTHDGTATAVDLATAEPPQPLGDAWLVRVHVVVLRGDTRRWRTATHETWAVPVARRDGRVVGLDRPWRVARRRPRVHPPAWKAARVDAAAIRAALRRAHLRPAAELRPQRSTGLPGVVRVRAADRDAAWVWLRTTPSVRVLGTAAPPREAP